MRLPVDIPDLMRSGGKIREQREMPIRIAIFVEADAPDGLVDAVREALHPQTANARIHVDVVGPDDVLIVDPLADAVVGVVGGGQLLPRSLEAARDRGVPTVALVQSLEREAWARVLGHPVRDVIGDPDAEKLVTHDLGAWFSDRLETKRLALAVNFAFMRRVVALEAVNTTAFQNAAIGTAPFLPGTDMPIMTANQMKMVLQIAAAYGEPMTAQRMRELGVVLGGAFAFRAVARTAMGFIPGFGWAIRGGIGYTGTVAMGRAAIEYFEAGGTPQGLSEKLKETAEKLRRGAPEEPLPAHAVVVGTEPVPSQSAPPVMLPSAENEAL